MTEKRKTLSEDLENAITCIESKDLSEDLSEDLSKEAEIQETDPCAKRKNY